MQTRSRMHVRLEAPVPKGFETENATCGFGGRVQIPPPAPATPSIPPEAMLPNAERRLSLDSRAREALTCGRASNLP